MRKLADLIVTKDPAIVTLRDLVRDAELPCELLPPSDAREAVLFDVQVSTRSTLGALACETGGLLIDDGWIRLLGSGHPRLSRTLPGWNKARSDGYYLVADDAAGGFFAINGGALGPQLKSVYYWAPDTLEWKCLDLGFTDFVAAFLTSRVSAFYEGLRWSTWRDDLQGLSGDRCFMFLPFLWLEGDSIEARSRRTIPIHEAFDMKVDIVRQLRDGA